MMKKILMATAFVACSMLPTNSFAGEYAYCIKRAKVVAIAMQAYYYDLPLSSEYEITKDDQDLQELMRSSYAKIAAHFTDPASLNDGSVDEYVSRQVYAERTGCLNEPDQ